MQPCRMNCRVNKKMTALKFIPMKHASPATQDVCPTCSTKRLGVGKDQLGARSVLIEKARYRPRFSPCLPARQPFKSIHL